MKSLTLSFLFVLFLFSVQAQENFGVKVYEGKEKIPTYQKGPDETSPLFFTGRGVQGTSGHIYPYPAQTNLSNTLTMETYDMVYLENKYLKVTILPAFGGKLYSAIDKTNGHELFHRNSVIKPDLIGTLGAWISGGIEWCFPNHHRTTTLLPADYGIEQNEDGSATVWIGETERNKGLRGVVGVTLHPNRSYIEADYRLNNTTDVTKTFLFWANVAVTADSNFRTSWPPSQEIGVFHNNSSFTHWPTSHEVYYGVDYTAGVDLTWWKNHPKPVSFFYWQGKEGFIGGYDYAKKAGEVHVGDPHINQTSKLWQFGPGLEGQNADRKLTDDGRAYVELMTGTYSNNQPDYSWFVPHSVKDAKNFWYPIRDLEIVKNANINASVTLQMRNANTVFYGFNTTRLYKKAKSILKLGGKILEEKTIDIDPSAPFTSTYKSKEKSDEYQLYVELQDSDGNLIISYTPYVLKHPPLPKIQDRLKSPNEIETIEDLYLTGRHIDQFSLPGHNPDEYYMEALKRSPNDYRVNIAMGIRRVKQWRYQEAEEYLLRAAEKLQVDYMQPEEGELFYYLALARKGLGKTKEAYTNFYRATWYYDWFSSAYYELALMESCNKNYAKALGFIKKAYSTNNYDGKITILYSAMLRKQGQKEEAQPLLQKLLKYDPLNFAAIYENELWNGNSSLEKWQRNMQDRDNNYLDVAMNYINAGLFDDGLSLLSSIKEPKNPLVFYYLAWLYGNSNQPSKAAQLLSNVNTVSFDYCFPYRKETEAMLKYAIEKNPQSANAYYLLGNLLYDNRPSDAINAWRKAAQLDKSHAMTWRNLAFGAFYMSKKTDSAIYFQKKAIAEDKRHPLWFAELANYYDLSTLGSKEILSILEDNKEVVKKDILAPQYLVKLYNLNGDYDKAIALLKTHHFRTWEGGTAIHDDYVDAHVLKALALMRNQKFENAINKLEDAFLYPENLEVGKSLNDNRNAMIYYFMAENYKRLHKEKKARDCYRRSAQSKNGYGWEDLIYYQAKSFRELGEPQKADELFKALIEKGKLIIEKGLENTGIAVENASANENKHISEGYYLQALGNIGLGNIEKAKALLLKATDEYKNNLWAGYYFNKLSTEQQTD